MTVNGVAVSSVVDSYRAWPRWWEGQAPRDYFVVQVDEKVLEIYRSGGDWFYSKTLD